MLTPRAAVTLPLQPIGLSSLMDYAGSAIDATLVADAILPVLLVASAALTAPLSLVLLTFYRRAVVRAMGASAGAAKPASVAVVGSAPSVPLEIELLEPALAGAAHVPEYERALRSLTSATLVYMIAGFAYAIVLTSPYVVLTEGGVPLPRVLWLLSCYLWPAALAA